MAEEQIVIIPTELDGQTLSDEDAVRLWREGINSPVGFFEDGSAIPPTFQTTGGEMSADPGRFPILTQIGEALSGFAQSPVEDLQGRDIGYYTGTPSVAPEVTRGMMRGVGDTLETLSQAPLTKGSGLATQINPELASSVFDSVDALSNLVPQKAIGAALGAGIIKTGKGLWKGTSGDVFVPDPKQVSDSVLNSLKGTDAATDAGEPMVMFRFTSNKPQGLGKSRSLRGPREMGMHVGSRRTVEEGFESIEIKQLERMAQADKEVADILENPMLTLEEKTSSLISAATPHLLIDPNKAGVTAPLLVDIKNPLEMPDLTVWSPSSVANHLINDPAIKLSDESRESLRMIVEENADTDDMLIKNIGVSTSKEEIDRIQNLLLTLDSSMNREIQDILKEEGYDGIKYVNKHEGVGDTSFIAFDDNQIKYLDEWNKDVPTKKNTLEADDGRGIRMEERDGKLLPEEGIFTDDAGQLFSVDKDGNIEHIDIDSSGAF